MPRCRAEAECRYKAKLIRDGEMLLTEDQRRDNAANEALFTLRMDRASVRSAGSGEDLSHCCADFRVIGFGLHDR
jgi:hypothetical protein